MNIYFDESGDLGWTFDKPYREEGSSRFLTIAHVFVEEADIKHLGRFVRSLYKARRRPARIELKATNLTGEERLLIADTAVGLIRAGVIQIHAITVKKTNVDLHIRENENVIYNYMVKKCIFRELAKYPLVKMLPDKRSIKVRYASSLEIYLQTALFEKGYRTAIAYIPQESDKNLQVQFADYITNIIWRRHEAKDSAAYQILHPHISHKVLFPRPRSSRLPTPG